jgi:hypothetical protein
LGAPLLRHNQDTSDSFPVAVEAQFSIRGRPAPSQVGVLVEKNKNRCAPFSAVYAIRRYHRSG